MVSQVAHRHSPGLANRGGASRHGYVVKVRGAFETLEVGDEDLAAPDVAVSTVTGAIEGEADNFAFEMVLGHATGDMGMMVLHSDQRQAGFLQGPFGGEVIRVQVVGD